MASCCGSTSCMCKVEAGDGLLVEGTGAANNPFTISLEEPAVIDQIIANRITVGQETFPRELVTVTTGNATSGTVELTFFTAYKSELITNVRTMTGTSAAGATPTLCRVGLYLVEPDDDLALIAYTANDTGMWSATNASYLRALQAPVAVTAGQRYAMGRIIVSGTTMPSWIGSTIAGAGQTGIAPRLQGSIAGQADLPAVIAAGAMTNGTTRRYGEIRA